MTISKDGGVWWVSCDNDCGEATDLNDEDEEFARTVHAIKEAGWKFIKSDGGHGPWEHMCPSCQEDASD